VPLRALPALVKLELRNAGNGCVILKTLNLI